MVYLDPWEHYINILKALSDPTRFKIIWLLCIIDSRICSSEIAEVLGETPYNISRHIKVLKNAGLISEKKEGTRIFYNYRSDLDAFETSVLSTVMSLPTDMMAEEVSRCKIFLDRRTSHASRPKKKPK